MFNFYPALQYISVISKLLDLKQDRESGYKGRDKTGQLLFVLLRLVSGEFGAVHTTLQSALDKERRKGLSYLVFELQSLLLCIVD